MISSAEEFVELRSSESPEEYGRAAREEAPAEVWREVIEKYPEFRYWVAHNKSVPLDILKILAGDQDVRVRDCVAGKRKLDEATQEQLAKDPDSGVRMRIARNKKASERVLALLLEDPWDEIRKVARERLGLTPSADE
jgi:hypothetical protein